MSSSTVPFYPISEYYKSRFGKKLKKIPVTIADDCPNRRGINGMQTCIFCDVWGSAAYPEQRRLGLKAQIEEKKVYFQKKYKSENFLVYFQAYTSTFLGIQVLRDHYEEALSISNIDGIVIGTRPDCLSVAVLDLWNEFKSRCVLSVELGVQSFFEDQIRFLRRGHSAEISKKSICRIKEKCNVDLGIHLIFGLPGETDAQIIETAKIVSDLPIDHVKLHNLHVLKNTPLEKLFEQNLFTPIDLDDYAAKVGLFLQYLSPRVAIDRLAALSSRWDELVAPEWTRHKMKSHQHILNHLSHQKIYQGQRYGAL